MVCGRAGGPIFPYELAGLSLSRLTKRGILVGVRVDGALLSVDRREEEDGTARIDGEPEIGGKPDRLGRRV